MRSIPFDNDEIVKAAEHYADDVLDIGIAWESCDRHDCLDDFKAGVRWAQEQLLEMQRKAAYEKYKQKYEPGETVDEYIDRRLLLIEEQIKILEKKMSDPKPPLKFKALSQMEYGSFKYKEPSAESLHGEASDAGGDYDNPNKPSCIRHGKTWVVATSFEGKYRWSCTNCGRWLNTEGVTSQSHLQTDSESIKCLDCIAFIEGSAEWEDEARIAKNRVAELEKQIVTTESCTNNPRKPLPNCIHSSEIVQWREETRIAKERIQELEESFAKDMTMMPIKQFDEFTRECGIKFKEYDSTIDEQKKRIAELEKQIENFEVKNANQAETLDRYEAALIEIRDVKGRL